VVSQVVPPTILLIDDEQEILTVLKIFLEGDGYHVEIATTGERLRQEQLDPWPALSLLDVNLVEEDGRDLCRHLKANAATKDIPIILYSAAMSEKQLRKEALANDVLLKPFDLEDVRAKVHRLAPH
jgi:DNA-binding response OmpR family regulator